MRTIRKLKIISNNKVRANRENAKKSTGPRTVSGKEKVSGNALSHGLTAEKHVIIGESIDEFNTFKDSMFKVYQPFGAYEEEIKKIDTSYDDLDAYQKKRDAERQAELEKARAKQKKDFKFNFVKPRKDLSIYGGWVNAYEPVNKGRLGSTQEWKIDKLGRKYY